MDEYDYEIFKRKLSWHNAFAFVIFWLMIYIGIVVPQGERLPESLKISDEFEFPNAFIAERAKNVLKTVTNVGPRTVGSWANEFATIEVLKAEVESIKNALKPHQRLEVDVQLASGNFSIDKKVFVYRAVQNFIVKLSPFKSATNDCLLLSSHFDTVPQSPGAGDAGSMVAVMLETLRVLAKSRLPNRQTVVFLFSGATEPGWLGAHAFMTQHKWAKDCRVFINLAAFGWGGPLLLAQMTSDQELLTQLYRDLPQPFASSFFEELITTPLMHFKSDFRIFEEFGGLRGYDLALATNGYMHHTKFDRAEHYSMNALQHAGDNVLTLVRSLLNELKKFRSEMPLADEKMVYYDIFGYFLVLYPAKFGFLLNFSVCIIAGVAIILSLFEYSMSSGISFMETMAQFGATMLIQIFSLILGAALAILVAALLSSYDCTLCWFSNKWLLMGLYFCPMFFGMLIVPALTLKHIEYQCLDFDQKLKLLMHAHCVWLMVFTLILTMFEVRSAYLGMLAIVFYTFAIWTNLSSECRGSAYKYWFLVPILVSQIVPFVYFTSLTHKLYEFVVPLMGRAGVKTKPELPMAGIAIMMSCLFAGFIMPVFLAFQKTMKIALCFACFTLFSIILGNFLPGPFKAESAVERFTVYHEHRIYHDLAKVTTEQALIRVQIFDRSVKNIRGFSKLFFANEEISETLESARPCFLNGEPNFCLPISRPLAIARERYPKLHILSITYLSYSPIKRRFDFELIGPNYMYANLSLFNTKIVDWSFAKKDGSFPLEIKFVNARNIGGYNFYITFEHTGAEAAYFDIGITGQWHDEQQNYVTEFRRFIEAFPSYAFVDDRLATFEKWSYNV